MKEIKIEHLAYLLKQAKTNQKPQPIFFLGAGASRSGNIPLASEIVEQILKHYSDSPFVKDLPEEQRGYAKLMECLLPNQRDELLKKYIDEAKINVTHIYLAQLISEDYVDYVLTVNFDNLMLRALALYNIFPSTYDMAILKDFTTSKFKEKSVVYLHGQHHGLWLLNTQDEMDKVKHTVPRIFDAIKDQRPWVFIGYSGDDPIFEHVSKLGRFDNGLYWVTYQETSPNEHVQYLLTNPNTNAFVIKGYDADSFMMKLNNELELSQPLIVDKPFTALKNILEEIVDIDEQEHFKGVKERLGIAKRQVEDAIHQFEHGVEETAKNIAENKLDILKKEIINLLIAQKYDQNAISEIEEKTKTNPDKEVESLLAVLFTDWGADLGELAKTKEGKEAEDLYHQSFDKYRKAIEIKPDKHEAYNNWGNALVYLANTKEGKEAEDLYHQAFDKYRKAIEIKSDSHEAYDNWGNALGYLANTKEGKEAEDLYHQSFEKYRKAIEIDPNKYKAYNNWGTDLGNLAKTKDGREAEDLYHQSFEKYRKAIEIKPDFHEAYNNWGGYLVYLAKTKGGKEVEDLYLQSFDKYQKAVVLGGHCYNLACLHAIKENTKEALLYLNFSLSKQEVSVSFVQSDPDWKGFVNNEDYINILKKYA